MASVKGIRVCKKQNWRAASDLLSLIATSEHEVYFRGQANSAWKLQSSFGRLVCNLAEKHSWSETGRRDIEQELEKQLCMEFRKAYHRVPGVPPLPQQDDEEFLALAQHYSLPTRLLDWSRSPYIAAFFAFNGSKRQVFPSGQQVAIWALDWYLFRFLLYCDFKGIQPEPINLSVINNELLEKELKIIRQRNIPRIDKVEIHGNPNRRMVFQEGIFTRTIHVEDDIEAYVRRVCKIPLGPVLTKVVVPGHQQSAALKDLSHMTISPVTLMNDPEGAAATAFNSAVRFSYDLGIGQ